MNNRTNVLRGPEVYAQAIKDIESINEYLDDRGCPLGNGTDTYTTFGRVAFALDMSARENNRLKSLLTFSNWALLIFTLLGIVLGIAQI